MGNEADTTTGLDDFNAREYDPALGTFLSQDVVAGNAEAPVTEDAYVYGDDNPFTEADPTGMATSQQTGTETGIDLIDSFEGEGASLSSVPDGYSYYLEGGDSENDLNLLSLIEEGAVWAYHHPLEAASVVVTVACLGTTDGAGSTACLAVGRGIAAIDAEENIRRTIEGKESLAQAGVATFGDVITSGGVAYAHFTGDVASEHIDDVAGTTYSVVIQNSH
jgi:RHS repeat-associated protein